MDKRLRRCVRQTLSCYKHTDWGVAEGEAGEGQGFEPSEPGGTVPRQEVCFEGPPTRSRGTHMTWPNQVAPLEAERRLVSERSNLKPPTHTSLHNGCCSPEHCEWVCCDSAQGTFRAGHSVSTHFPLVSRTFIVFWPDPYRGMVLPPCGGIYMSG